MSRIDDQEFAGGLIKRECTGSDRREPKVGSARSRILDLDLHLGPPLLQKRGQNALLVQASRFEPGTQTIYHY